MCENTERNWDAGITEIGDKIVALTVLQAKELGDYLEDVHGIKPASGGVVMAGGPAGGGEEQTAEEEKDSFDVILTGSGDKKIQVIKVVRAATSLGLKEAKALVDGLPSPVKEGLPKDEAEKLKAEIEAAGGSVELK